MPRILICLALIAVTGLYPASSRAADDVVEQQTPLSVMIDGHAERLETLIVRPAAEDRYPLALIVNGAFPNPKASHPEWLASLAHDFAHRGWLAAVIVWRSYGNSTGTVQNDAGTCTAPDPAKFVDAHAADLAAALSSLQARPDVDPAITLGLGTSIGGASMLDLAAEPGHKLTAVINISGGVWHDAKPFRPDPTCGPFEDELVRSVGRWGRAAIPTLWLYALNDPWFQPVLVRRMASAYRQGGGDVDLKMLPPFGSDGHTLYLWEASPLTQPIMDAFLRAHGLPSMTDDQAFAPIAAALDDDDKQLLSYYLRMPTEKALAVPTGHKGGVYLAYAQRSLEDARQQALGRCQAISRSDCEVVAENVTLIGAWKNSSTGGSGDGH